ncbi:response regulator [Paenibacillus silvisoli]|uniref:response regulator n=1 Tax=Paenibacillus silvisoli TaxID=3110539 RepID=UPI0028050E7D|nr:response regulator [Paenibacillus silvisoli]
MIRLLIVDDEPIERRALQKMIEDAFEEVEVVGQAGNGREAIEAADRLQPDLITMDIKMPGIDGLKAIEGIKAANGGIKFIMVTAYDTFEFARQALKLGVSDYLLKPSKKAAIQETVGKVIDEIKAQRLEADRRLKDRERLQRLLPIVEADLVSQLLFDHMPSKHLDDMMELLGLPESRSGFVLHLHLSEPKDGAGGGIEEAGRLLNELYGRIAAQLEDVSCWLGRLSGKQLAMIVYLNGDQSYRSCAIGIGRRLIQLAERHGGFEPFVGIGGLCGNARHMRRSYHEALLASADVTLPSRYCFYEDIPHHAVPSIGLITAGIEKHVLEEVRLGRWDSAADQIWQLIDVYDGAGEQVGMAQQHTFEMLVIVTRMLQEMGVEVRKKPYYSQLAASYKQLKADTRGLIEQLAETTVMRLGESESDVVLTLKRYIREHAHEDLSLERVAAVADRNPFYVSKLFKEHFGMNYIDYLTECRMESAKQLMQETDKSLKEITYEVGYNDPNYFSRVFKKIIGHSPTEYRKMLLRPSNLKRG